MLFIGGEDLQDFKDITSIEKKWKIAERLTAVPNFQKNLNSLIFLSPQASGKATNFYLKYLSFYKETFLNVLSTITLNPGISKQFFESLSLTANIK